MNAHARDILVPRHSREAHTRLAMNFERWIGVCLRAGEPDIAETCRADAELHARMADERNANERRV